MLLSVDVETRVHPRGTQLVEGEEELSIGGERQRIAAIAGESGSIGLGREVRVRRSTVSVRNGEGGEGGLMFLWRCHVWDGVMMTITSSGWDHVAYAQSCFGLLEINLRETMHVFL